jgi:hypothetical protein
MVIMKMEMFSWMSIVVD